MIRARFGMKRSFPTAATVDVGGTLDAGEDDETKERRGVVLVRIKEGDVKADRRQGEKAHGDVSRLAVLFLLRKDTAPTRDCAWGDGGIIAW